MPDPEETKAVANNQRTPYYVLLIREGGRWTNQFGDYTRKVVCDERRDCYEDTLSCDWQIVVTTERQQDIDAVIAALNLALEAEASYAAAEARIARDNAAFIRDTDVETR